MRLGGCFGHPSAPALLLLLPWLASAATTSGTQTVLPSPPAVEFTLDETPLSPLPFLGLGLEVQNYEYHIPAAKHIVEASRRLALTRFPMARVMLRAWWYTTGFDEAGDPLFDWNGGGGRGRMPELWRVLTFLNRRNVSVIIGEWDDPTSPFDRPALYGAQPNPDPLQRYNISGTDPRWSRLICSFLHEAITVRNFTNIKYYNLYNEPNMPYSNNPNYQTWSRAVQLLLDEMPRWNLSLEVVGPDVTGGSDWIDMMLSDEGLKGKIPSISIHRYVDEPEQIWSGRLATEVFGDLRRRTDQHSATPLPILLSEAGLAYGKQKDSQTLRGTFDYGLWMSDLTIQAILSGLQSVFWWTPDDAMLVGGGYGSKNLKGWGFWNALAGSYGYPKDDFVPRPFFRAFQLLARFVPANSTVLSVWGGAYGVRCATVRPASGELTIACVAYQTTRIRISAPFALPERLVEYVYAEGETAVLGNGFPRARGAVEITDNGITADMEKGLWVATSLR